MSSLRQAKVLQVVFARLQYQYPLTRSYSHAVLGGDPS